MAVKSRRRSKLHILSGIFPVKVQRQLQKLEVMNQERVLLALEFEAGATGLWSLFHFLPEHEFRVTTPKTQVETPVKTPDLILEILASNSEMTLAEVVEALAEITPSMCTP